MRLFAEPQSIKVLMMMILKMVAKLGWVLIIIIIMVVVEPLENSH